MSEKLRDPISLLVQRMPDIRHGDTHQLVLASMQMRVIKPGLSDIWIHWALRRKSVTWTTSPAIVYI